MTCSRKSSDDLPTELLSEIIQYFRYDHKTLHSCILVNKLWSRIAIPLLWEHPFSSVKNTPGVGHYNIIAKAKNDKIIEIYLSYLNEQDKSKFNETISNLILSNKSLFNYPNLIKHLDTFIIIPYVQMWLNSF